jgi:hypothetical protein
MERGVEGRGILALGREGVGNEDNGEKKERGFGK